MDNSDKSNEDLKRGYNCAQSVLAAFGPEYGLPEEIAFQLTTGLAGGIAYRGHTCGAVLGSLLVIGLKYGK